MAGIFLDSRRGGGKKSGGCGMCLISRCEVLASQIAQCDFRLGFSVVRNLAGYVAKHAAMAVRTVSRSALRSDREQRTCVAARGAWSQDDPMVGVGGDQHVVAAREAHEVDAVRVIAKRVLPNSAELADDELVVACEREITAIARPNPSGVAVLRSKITTSLPDVVRR
jgi:hypothetical protein